MTTRTQAVTSAIGLFAVWMLAIYLLEGRIGTFLKPDPASRFVYTIAGNVLIGTLGGALTLRGIVRRTGLPRVAPYGIAPPRRMLLLAATATVLAWLFLIRQELPTRDPVILGGDLYSAHRSAQHARRRGVIEGLGAGGNLDRYASPRLPLIATAIAAVVALIVADVVLIRPAVTSGSSG